MFIGLQTDKVQIYRKQENRRFLWGRDGDMHAYRHMYLRATVCKRPLEREVGGGEGRGE